MGNGTPAQGSFRTGKDGGAGAEPAGKPWYGKRCQRCGKPLNYAWAARAPIPGLCGRCHDERHVYTKGRLVAAPSSSWWRRRAGRRHEPGEDGAMAMGKEGGRGWRGGLGLVLLGALLGYAGAVLTAVLAEQAFFEITSRAAYWLGR
ncbi:MAG: hypothetical protein KatS3mg102_1795 [Planctomycetota bacterium]|nr:MAG: hypothetical protein KatS3mg102_1795 [Planctomycetota bacterium]